MRRYVTPVVAGFVLMLAAASAQSAPISGPPYNFPGFGNDTLGPKLLLTINPNGTVTVSNGPGFAQGPYDGAEDSYIGVINNFGAPVTALTIPATNTDIFGFDGDGIVAFGSGTNAQDSTGYGGPDAFFTNLAGTGLPPIDGPGIVHFINGGIPPGKADFFSLEEDVTAANFSGVVPVVGAVPEPTSLALLAMGLGGLAAYARRRKASRPAASL